MSQDTARVEELQSALRTKMADNKAIADSFKIEDGTVVVSTEQKSAFDKNMRDIKEIKSLLGDLQTMDSVDNWSAEPASGSVGSAYAASAADINQLSSFTLTSIFFTSICKESQYFIALLAQSSLIRVSPHHDFSSELEITHSMLNLPAFIIFIARCKHSSPIGLFAKIIRLTTFTPAFTSLFTHG
jgi:hypothetical protein